MDIVLIRHPPRERDVEEKAAPLSAEGQLQAGQLAKSLRNLSAGSFRLPSPFTVVVSSSYRPAKEMAEILDRSRQAPIYELDCLTPFGPGGDKFSTFFEDLQTKVGRVCDSDVIGVVGHEPRLGRLLSFLTSKDARFLDRGEAVWLHGPLEKFRKGKGFLLCSTTNLESVKILKEKVQSKMAVCIFSPVSVPPLWWRS